MMAISLTPELHWLDLIVHIILWPLSLLGLRYLYFTIRYRDVVGKYVGGSALLEINLRFLCVFRISCVEPEGQNWEGKSYKINDEGNYLTGLYVWNPHKDQIPDIGEHHLYFSQNRKAIRVYWKKLTGPDEINGYSEWKKETE